MVQSPIGYIVHLLHHQQDMHIHQELDMQVTLVYLLFGVIVDQ